MNLKKTFENIEEIVGAALFVVMFGILIAQITARQLFNSPLIWSEELSILLFVYIGMLGVSIGIKHEQHVMIDFFYNKLSPKGLKTVFTMIQTIVFLSLVAMIYLGYKLFKRKLIFNFIAIKISYGWMYGALPLIGALMMYRFIGVCIRQYKEGRFIVGPKEEGEKVW